MEFICGCPFPLVKERTIVVSEDETRVEKYLDGFHMIDSYGLVVCSVHRKRRRGYLSLPMRPDGKYPDFRFSSYPPVAVERWLLFGELPSNFPVTVVPEPRLDEDAA